MLSPFAKAVLVATSLAPIAFGYGVVGYGTTGSFRDTWHWFVIGGCLVLIAYLMPLVALYRAQVVQLNIKSVKDADKEILAFLIAYLLPLAGGSTLDIETHRYAVIYVFGMIFWAVYHTNAFTFNPVLGIFGYHFFEVETVTGMKYLLITRSVIRKQEIHPWVVQLSDYVFLEGKEPDDEVQETGEALLRPDGTGAGESRKGDQDRGPTSD